jgi:hypothetical protein
MTYEGLGEVFEGEFADTCGEICSLMLMGGWAEGLAYAELGARISIGMSGNFLQLSLQWSNMDAVKLLKHLTWTSSYNKLKPNQSVLAWAKV